jgi:NTP pyrophosphatase (non-canonical NTP hydrolase)
MKLEDLTNKAVEIRTEYDRLNAKRGVTWNEQDFMAGFVGDVGDLSKLIMAKQGLREIADVDVKLAHELADCLWSILIISNKYGIDLELEFNKTMSELQRRITNQA